MIVAFNAFWRNQTPGGLGFMVRATPEDPDRPSDVIDQITGDGLPTYDMIYAKNPEFRQECEAQLEYYANQPRDERQELTAQILMMTNIAWLEYRGWLKADEYNGTQIVEIENASDEFLKQYGLGLDAIASPRPLRVAEGNQRVISFTEFYRRRHRTGR